MQPLKPIRTLYMEDDKGLAGLLQRKMRRESYDVDIVYDGLKGLAILASQAYDALLVDHKMPGLSGLEVIRRLAAGGMLLQVAHDDLEGLVEERTAELKVFQPDPHRDSSCQSCQAGQNDQGDRGDFSRFRRRCYLPPA